MSQVLLQPKLFQLQQNTASTEQVYVWVENTTTTTTTNNNNNNNDKDNAKQSALYWSVDTGNGTIGRDKASGFLRITDGMTIEKHDNSHSFCIKGSQGQELHLSLEDMEDPAMPDREAWIHALCNACASFDIAIATPGADPLHISTNVRSDSVNSLSSFGSDFDSKLFDSIGRFVGDSDADSVDGEWSESDIPSPRKERKMQAHCKRTQQRQRASSASASPGGRREKLVQRVWGGIGEAEYKSLKVRGQNYLKDHKKYYTKPYLFTHAHTDLWNTSKKLTHAAQDPQSWINTHVADYSAQLTLVINFVVPGSPMYNFVSYFTRAEPLQPDSDVAHERLLAKFWHADDEWRDNRVKFIPNVQSGSWLVRKGVGNKPAIIGKKLTHSYFQDHEKNYLEIDIDVSSSRIANSLLGLCMSVATTLELDFNFLLEGQTADELPERLLAGVCLSFPHLMNTSPKPALRDNYPDEYDDDNAADGNDCNSSSKCIGDDHDNDDDSAKGKGKQKRGEGWSLSSSLRKLGF